MAFGVMLAWYVAGSFFPEARLWGVNTLGYLPVAMTIGYQVMALAVALGGGWLLYSKGESLSDAGYTRLVVVGLAVAKVAFVLFHTRTHFLGDGYTSLSLLASDNPLIKWRNFGGAVLPYGLAKALGPLTEATVWRAYQLVAYTAGVLMVILTAGAARRLYEQPIDRLLFLLGLITGGHMLLFFGYVENYALFVVSVVAYCLVGMMVVDGRMSRGWLVAAQLLAVFFHVFGILLLPATLVVLARGTAVSRWFAARSRLVRSMMAMAAVLIAVTGVVLLTQRSYAVRFALVPFTQTPFAVDGYTLFSGAHLADFLNLLITLWPGLAVAAAVVIGSRKSRAGWSPRTRFLLLVSLLTLGGAFVFDPKIGMPRDWDLFAFAGIPLGILLFDRLCGMHGWTFRTAALLSAVVALMALAARVTVLARPEAALQQNRAYLYLDPVKNHNVWSILKVYHEQAGDSATARAVQDEMYRVVPEEQWLTQAREAMRRGDSKRAVQLALRAAPRYRGVGIFHADYGSALLNLQRHDEAFEELQIAGALNPYNPIVQANLGFIYLSRNDPEAAEACWRRTLARDSVSGSAIYGMVAINFRRGTLEPLPALLEKGSVLAQMPLDFYSMIADAAIRGQAFALAARALVLGQGRGVPDDEIRRVLATNPSLVPHYEAERQRLAPGESGP